MGQIIWEWGRARKAGGGQGLGCEGMSCPCPTPPRDLQGRGDPCFSRSGIHGEIPEGQGAILPRHDPAPSNTKRPAQRISLVDHRGRPGARAVVAWRRHGESGRGAGNYPTLVAQGDGTRRTGERQGVEFNAFLHQPGSGRGPESERAGFRVGREPRCPFPPLKGGLTGESPETRTRESVWDWC